MEALIAGRGQTDLPGGWRPPLQPLPWAPGLRPGEAVVSARCPCAVTSRWAVALSSFRATWALVGKHMAARGSLGRVSLVRKA